MNIIPYSALTAALDVLASSGSWRCHLYTEPAAIYSSTAIGDLVEADYSGYPAGGLPVGPFAASSIVRPRAVAYAPACVFTHNGGPVINVIRGAYFTDPGSTVLYWIDAFGGPPIRLAAAGDSIDVVPTLALRSEFV